MNIDRFDDLWMDYAISTWDAAARPHGLDPRDALSNPIGYDRCYYDYFERRYLDMWLALYSRVNPTNGTLLKRESFAFRNIWKNNFSWETIWKQTLPLFVYGSTLGARNEILVELASMYCLGQAIPSMVIDRMLDDDDKPYNDGAAFCMLAYAKSLKCLRSMKLPCEPEIENVFIGLTSEMYEKMLTEHGQRFAPLPGYPSDAIIEYLSPRSRLLSSVFFGILPIWANILTTNRVSSALMKESTAALRAVRQLNDEILDANDDICHGLLTLPWLYALEETPELREKIENLWKDTRNANALKECQIILEKSNGRQRATAKSLEILSLSMKATRESFNANRFFSTHAFEITLLHNIRWTLLNWLEKVDYKRDPKTIRQPCLPQDTILDVTRPIEPIPGAGVLVTNADHKVLMTLVMKREMLRWELPAGVAKDGETLEKAARREAREETGKAIEIGEVVAMSWHHSRKLDKGWMGLIFQGRLVDATSSNDFKLITPQGFAHSKFNIYVAPELYQSIDLETCDFEALNSLCEKQCLISTAHESVIASGFVDWRRIPDGRIHPLHQKLLEARMNGHQDIVFLVSNADDDIKSYNAKSELYQKD